MLKSSVKPNRSSFGLDFKNEYHHILDPAEFTSGQHALDLGNLWGGVGLSSFVFTLCGDRRLSGYTV